MRQFLFFITVLLPLQSWAACPPLNDIKEVLKEIHDRLTKNPENSLSIRDVDYMVRHGEGGKAVEDILAGDYRGYVMDRLKETTPGVCRYRLRDDKTPMRGHFILLYH